MGNHWGEGGRQLKGLSGKEGLAHGEVDGVPLDGYHLIVAVEHTQRGGGQKSEKALFVGEILQPIIKMNSHELDLCNEIFFLFFFEHFQNTRKWDFVFAHVSGKSLLSTVPRFLYQRGWAEIAGQWCSLCVWFYWEL